MHPDGKRLLFDLLGDLYTLPIEGGEAQALTHSMAWEQQARWSPDGKQIAYLHNLREPNEAAHRFPRRLWVMNADGTGKRPLTRNERFPSVLFPSWSPDGKLIAYFGSRVGRGPALEVVPTVDGPARRLAGNIQGDGAVTWQP
mgnify:CR=1 FL=1